MILAGRKMKMVIITMLRGLRDDNGKGGRGLITVYTTMQKRVEA